MLKKLLHPKWKLPLFFISGVILLLWVVWALPCPIRRLTGVICPACGMSRAWLACARLDFAAAFRCHPMFWSVPVLVFYLLCDCRPFSRKRLNTALPCCILLGVTVCYAVRLFAFLSGNLPI